MIGRVLKDVLFPERIGSYYAASKRVVGIDINKTTIYATRISYAGRSITIEKNISQPLSTDAAIAYQDRVQQALESLLDACKPYDHIRLSFPSSRAVFKELVLPFDDQEKIAKTINFELESFLPFSTAQAVISFIITNRDTKLHTTTIMAGAASYDQLDEYLQLVPPPLLTDTAISIDIFDLYNLYYILTPEKERAGAQALVHIDFQITRVLYMVDGRLKFSRTLPKGMATWAKSIAATMNMSPNQALESLLRFGIQDTGKDGYLAAVETTLNDFLRDVRFTVDSFNQMLGLSSTSQIILAGPGTEPMNMLSFAQHIVEAPCRIIDPHQLKKGGISIINGVTLTQDSLLSLATALITPMTADVTMNKAAESHQASSLFNRQAIWTAILFGCLLAMLGVHTWWQTRKLRLVARQAEQDMLTALRKEGLTTKRGLSDALRDAEEKVKEQEDIWFAFSDQTRFSFLKYLHDLSIAIDRNGLGLKLQRLTINQRDNRLTLTGQVRDFDALKALEQDLRQSGIFIYIPSLQATKFDVSLLLKKTIQE